jgi:hypothetical protein
VGQRATLTRQNKSYLYDVDGNLLNTLIHDYDTKQIGITDDNNYFWFASNKMRMLNPGEIPLYPSLTRTPYNHVMVFNAVTGIFKEEYRTDETRFNFTINNKVYTITLTPPDLPG